MVIAIAQLMVVLDASIVNIALPSIQADLGITDANRQWVVTAYTLAFGGLLLLGGRISDFWGRKKAFMTGLWDLLAHRNRWTFRKPGNAFLGPRIARCICRATCSCSAVLDYYNL
jgi:MFS family permease